MPYIEDNVLGRPNDLGSLLDQEMTGAFIQSFRSRWNTVPASRLPATTNRDILCKVAGLMVPFDSSQSPRQGPGTYPRSLPGQGIRHPWRDIDSNYSVQFGTWLSKVRQTP